jgi:hypothetical protein
LRHIHCQCFRILASQLNVLRVSSRLSTVSLPARSTSAFKFRSFHSTPASRDIDGAPKPDADGNKVIYIGPANGNIRFIKRLAAATVFCFSVAYPVAAIGLNLGTATLGLGSRLLFSAVGSIFSIGLTSVLHKYTKGVPLNFVLTSVWTRFQSNFFFRLCSVDFYQPQTPVHLARSSVLADRRR